MLLFALGANKQLVLDELIREIGRLAAKFAGVFAVRHLITGTAALVIAVGAGWLMTRLYLRAGPSRDRAVALALLAVPTAWFSLSVSHTTTSACCSTKAGGTC